MIVQMLCTCTCIFQKLKKGQFGDFAHAYIIMWVVVCGCDLRIRICTDMTNVPENTVVHVYIHVRTYEGKAHCICILHILTYIYVHTCMCIQT